MRATRLLGPLLLVLALGAPAARAADDRIIPEYVSAGGVDLSLLTVDEATAKLAADPGLHRSLRHDAVLRAGARTWRLTMARAGLRFDPAATARRAALVPTPVPPDGSEENGGSYAGVEVPLAVRHSRAAVRAFVAGVARRSVIAPRNATLRITLRHMRIGKARLGRRLQKSSAAAALNTQLAGIERAAVAGRMLPVRPRTTIRSLRRAYPNVITVDREHFRLRLFHRLRLSRRYGIAVGMAGLTTPAGFYRIQDKQVDPAWHVPRSPWAGSLQGQTIPGGAPDNPLKARWMGIANGVGIHGTAEDWSIGSRASHGCIRMHVPDVIDLFDRVAVGTPVLIG